MNFIITKKCDKGCSYCFTDKNDRSNQNQKDMSLDDIKEILYKFPQTTSAVRLLGGEPTQHPQFTEILEELLFKRETEHLFIISNFLFDKKILDYFVYILRDKNLRSKVSFLANGTELNIKNRMPVFKRNYETLYDIYNARGVNGITLTTTLTEYNDFDYYKKYFKWIYSELNRKVKKLRFGIDLSSTKIINNTKYGDIIYHLYSEYVLKEKIAINADCIVPQCVFSDDLKNNKQDLFFSNTVEDLKPTCTGCVMDVFPDMSAIYCYQASECKVDNILEFPTGDAICNSLNEQYQNEIKKYQVPQDCLNCICYKNETCKGLCIGCYNNND